MNFEDGIKLDFKDVLIRPKRSNLDSRSKVDLHRTFTFVHSKQQWTGVPIVAANMDTTGTFAMADALAKHDLMTAFHKHYSIEDLVDFFQKRDDKIYDRVFYSMGITNADYKKFDEVNKMLDDRIRMVCIDVANGYQEVFVDFVKKMRQNYPKKTLMAGSVVTKEMTEALTYAGADIIKVGIGAGSVCTTRRMAGVGYPQLSALIECADAAHGLFSHIIADGGVAVPGDVAKAFGAGSDFIMSGSFFAGHDESGGEIIERDGKKFKPYYGMSSDVAMKKYSGGVAAYRASEGKRVEIPYRGPVDKTVQAVLGGLRSACTYVGAKDLKGLPRRTTFIRVNNQLNELYTGFERPEEDQEQ